MKLLIATILLILSVSIARSDDEKMKQVMKIVSDCKMTTGASDDDVAKMMMHELPDNHNAKCMFSCIMDAMGIVS